ncbi:hypothetical protein SAMN05216525_13361 [Bradyrhizobium sp. Gha]|nr:hypothetical protein SAMN05216525_13361 [Bradyrhizobium sp. Gha]
MISGNVIGFRIPVGRDIALAGHLDAPTHVVELWDRVRIRIDGLMLSMQPNSSAGWCSAIEVKTQRMCVDLDDDVMLRADPQHLLDVDFVARPLLNLPPGRVAHVGRLRIGNRPQQVLRLRLAIQLEHAQMNGLGAGRNSSEIALSKD